MLQGSAWDWQSPADCKLVGQLQAVVGEIHAAGVVHVDLESQNIKVTSNKEVYVLDFEKASVASMSPQYTEELCHEQARLDYLSTVVSERVSRLSIFCIVLLVIRVDFFKGCFIERRLFNCIATSETTLYSGTHYCNR